MRPRRCTSRRRPMTSTVAARWVAELPGAGLDGVIARPLDGVYTPGKRTLFKIKPSHTVDVVCAGWRPYKQPGPDGGEVVGSVLIGLYDEVGVLQMIGAMSAFPMAQRVELAARFADLAAGPDHPWFEPEGRAPGMPSRWSSGRSSEWNPLRPELVAEVSYNQVESGTAAPPRVAGPLAPGQGRRGVHDGRARRP